MITSAIHYVPDRCADILAPRAEVTDRLVPSRHRWHISLFVSVLAGSSLHVMVARLNARPPWTLSHDCQKEQKDNVHGAPRSTGLRALSDRFAQGLSLIRGSTRHPSPLPAAGCCLIRPAPNSCRCWRRKTRSGPPRTSGTGRCPEAPKGRSLTPYAPALFSAFLIRRLAISR